MVLSETSAGRRIWHDNQWMVSKVDVMMYEAQSIPNRVCNTKISPILSLAPTSVHLDHWDALAAFDVMLGRTLALVFPILLFLVLLPCLVSCHLLDHVSVVVRTIGVWKGRVIGVPALHAVTFLHLLSHTHHGLVIASSIAGDCHASLELGMSLHFDFVWVTMTVIVDVLATSNVTKVTISERHVDEWLSECGIAYSEWTDS